MYKLYFELAKLRKKKLQSKVLHTTNARNALFMGVAGEKVCSTLYLVVTCSHLEKRQFLKVF